jgi:hypothetical protein
VNRVAPSVVVSLLTEARNLIATRGLSQGAGARDRDGARVDVHAPTAVTISVRSAILVAARRVNASDRDIVVAIEKVIEAASAKPRANAGWALADHFDAEGMTTAKVVETFNKAIASVAPALRRAVGG